MCTYFKLLSWKKAWCFWIKGKVICPYSNACIIFSCLIFLASWKWDESTSYSSCGKRNTGKVHRKYDSKSIYRFWSLPPLPEKSKRNLCYLMSYSPSEHKCMALGYCPLVKPHLWKMKISPKSTTII